MSRPWIGVFVLSSLLLAAASACDGGGGSDTAGTDAAVVEPDASDATSDATSVDDADALGDASDEFWVRDVRLSAASGEPRTADDLLLSMETGADVLGVVTDWRVNGEGIAELILPLDRIDDATSPQYSQSGGNCSLGSAATSPTLESGQIGGAYLFDGLDDELICQTRLDFTQPFSFEAWIRPQDAAQMADNAGVAAAVDDQQQWSWQLRYGAPDRGGLGFKLHPVQGEPVWLSADEAAGSDQWHHVVGTHDGTTARMYVDGVEVDSASVPRLAGVNQVLIGQDGWEQYFGGGIDGVRVFSRALSSAQIAAFYEAGLSGDDGRSIRADETSPGESWQACVTPTGDRDDGQAVCSNVVELEPGETGVPADAKDVTDLGIRGDGSDETAAIQALLDNADAGDAFYFPATDDFYGIGSPGLTLNKPVRLYGDGWESGGAGRRRDSVGTFSGSELRNVDPGGWSGIFMAVKSNDVLIDGLQMRAESYVGVDWADRYVTRVLSVDAGGGGRYQNFTLRNSWLEGAESVLWIDHVDDFIVDNTHVWRARQSLIFIKLSRRGMVRSTNYWDVGEPPEGGPAWEGGGNPKGKGYGLVVTTPRTQPDRSSDMLIYDNWGKGVALWFADHNHGCHRYLSFNNVVQDSRYGFSGSALNTSDYGLDHDQWYLNNTTVDMRLDAPAGFTSTGFAFTSGRYLDGFHTIGNVATRTDNRTHRAETFRARGQAGGGKGVVTWNEIRGPASTPHLAAHNNPEMALAHNTIDGQPMQIDGTYDDISSQFSTPDAPTDLTAQLTHGGVKLSWDYATGDGHDSFFIEWAPDLDSEWERVAFTPPNNGIFDFDAPTNPHWERYDPLTWFDGEHQSGFYRIRANSGDKTSGWSNMAQVE